MSLVEKIRALAASYFKWFGRPTIARELSFRLMGMITLIFALSAIINYTFWHRRDVENQKQRLNQSMRDMSQVLTIPLWTFNEGDIRSIINSYATNEAITYIEVRDDEGKKIAAISKYNVKSDIKSTKPIFFKNQKIGSLTIGMTSAMLRERASLYYIQNTFLLFIILFGIFLLTKSILDKSLNRPLLKVIRGLREISNGEYQHRLRHHGHIDVDAIGKEVNRLAEQIESREETIKGKAASEAFLASEMTLANLIQNSMVAKEDLNQSSAITYFYKPLAQVGGDWFCTFTSNNKKYLYVFMGDVSGHGLPQSLITTAVLGALRGMEKNIRNADEGYSPAAVIETLRETTGDVLKTSNLGMTVIGARINITEKSIITVNAGHTFPLYFEPLTDGTIKIKTISSKVQPMLGSVNEQGKNHKYSEFHLELPEKCYLSFFTDGFLEVRDKEGYDFSRKLRRIITKTIQPGSVGYIRDQLVHALLKHGGDNFKDDVCLVLIDPSAKEESHAAA